MVRDARDNSTYWIQKLADNQCWMLTNLAYAGGGTNTYSDVIPSSVLTQGVSGNTYTEAKYYIPPGANPTTEPTQPSTATDGGANVNTRQYGYLYNFCGANGGQTGNGACSDTVSTVVDDSISVCPAGWRMPIADEFSPLNVSLNGGSTSSDIGLRSNPWIGQYSGRWHNGLNNQGVYGTYWSTSQYYNDPAYSHLGAYSLYHSNSRVNTKNLGSDTWYKINGHAVRCIAV